MPNRIDINGYWEKRGHKFIARWCFVWTSIGPNEFAGLASGYSGHGAFEFESVYVKVTAMHVSRLWIDWRDTLSEEEVDFDTLSSFTDSRKEEVDRVFWKYNDYDHWNDTDEIILKDELADTNVGEEKISVATATPFFVRVVCQNLGLTAAPPA